MAKRIWEKLVVTWVLRLDVCGPSESGWWLRCCSFEASLEVWWSELLVGGGEVVRWLSFLQALQVLVQRLAEAHLV